MPSPRLPVRRAPVRLVVVIGLLVLLLVALAARGERTEPDGAPAAPMETSGPSTTAVYAGPTAPSLNVVLAAAAKRYGAAIRATVAAAQPPPAPKPSPQARATGSPSSSAGDRFDRLAACESGGGVIANIDPGAVSPGGRYRGAFQFTLSSWAGAGESGDPVDHDYATQKAAAIRWAGMTRPAGQWPVCWPRTA